MWPHFTFPGGRIPTFPCRLSGHFFADIGVKGPLANIRFQWSFGFAIRLLEFFPERVRRRMPKPLRWQEGTEVVKNPSPVYRTIKSGKWRWPLSSGPTAARLSTLSGTWGMRSKTCLARRPEPLDFCCPIRFNRGVSPNSPRSR